MFLLLVKLIDCCVAGGVIGDGDVRYRGFLHGTAGDA